MDGRRLFCLALVSLSTSLNAGHIVLTEEAKVLHQSALLVDGHNDLPWMLRAAGDFDLQIFDLRQVLLQFHTDIPRLREGGMGAQFWSVYVNVNDPAPYVTTRQQMDLVARMARKYPEAFQLALSTSDIYAARASGKIASLMGVEGGHCIENSLAKLRELYTHGARYMTLTHSRNTPWADSATDQEVHGGLTSFGREVVREMNRLGMLVDISHVSVKTMRQAIQESAAPVIASHSSAYALTPHVRNVPDDILKLISEKDGVVMINFYSPYIQQPGRPVDVDTVLNHIDHIAKVAGVDHVGLGSDFDGVEELPQQLESVAQYPYITQGLLNRGYGSEDIKKILGENLMRVFAKAEEIALKARD